MIPASFLPILRSLRLPRLLPALAIFFAGCAQYATVAEKRPQFRPLSTTVGALVSFEKDLAKGVGAERRDPMAALGCYLTCVQEAGEALRKDPRNEDARRAYNFALSRVFSTIHKGNIDPWTKPLVVSSSGGDFVLSHQPMAKKLWHPSLYDFKPADQFDVRGTYVTEHTLKEGIGATLVAIGRAENPDARKDFAIPRVYYGITAVARFAGRRCIIWFEDPLHQETTTLNGRSYPLAADFTVPLAVMLASTNPKKLELARALRPEEYADTARLARLQPYDPNKTVVLFIHGLVDSQATWAPMLNSLRGDERIRKNYQFWFFSYPSGYPYPYSAALLRRELDGVEKRFPLRKKMIVVGHSMGGCISRLLITDADQKLWMEYFHKPPGHVGFTPETRQMLEEALIFHHRPEVGRVVFISSPLKGSDLASNWVGRFASSLMKAPTKLLAVGTETMKAVATGGDSLRLKRLPNSVDTLAPNNRFVKSINTIPVVTDIPYNVICGDRGKGGNKDHTPPVMSDGVVPYWSSHMEGAQSELIVPSTHSAHQNKQAIVEVARILRQQAGER